jgi:energy-coupling factor transporter ATP-binding protein EcfA2
MPAYEDDDHWYAIRAIESRTKMPAHLQSSLVRGIMPPVKVQKFDDRWALIGFRHTSDEPGYSSRPGENGFNLSIKKAERMLFLGMSGSGKTLTIRRLADCLHHAGYACVFLSDIKDEMKSSKRSTPARLVKFLDPVDVAQPMKMKVYRPVFFMKALDEDLPSENEPLRIPYSSVTLPELLIALGFNSEKYRNQQNVLSELWEKSKAESLEQLSEDVQVSVANAGIRDSILRAIKPLIAWKAFGLDIEGDIIRDLQEGYAVVLNMNGYDRISVGPATLPMIYLTIVQRLVVRARENAHKHQGPLERRLKRKVVFIVDEAPKFLTAGTLSAEELLKAVDVYRLYGVYMIFAGQTTDKIPKALMDQCRYIFFPYNVKTDVAWNILKNSQFYEYHPSKVQELTQKLRNLRILRDGRRQWVCLDCEEKTTEIFYAYPPLSAHTEE